MKNIVTLVFFACSVFRRDILTTVVKERYFSRKDWNCVNGLSFCQPAIRSKCKRRQILSQQYFSSPVRQFVIVFSILSCQHHHQHHWILFTTNWNTVSHFGFYKRMSENLPPCKCLKSSPVAGERKTGRMYSRWWGWSLGRRRQDIFTFYSLFSACFSFSIHIYICFPSQQVLPAGKHCHVCREFSHFRNTH